MTAQLAPPSPHADGTHRALRRLLREEDAWLLRQIGSMRPVIWLRPQPLGSAARHGILALRLGADATLRGALRAHATAWPWCDDGVPAIVLQHVMEGSAVDMQLVDEAARVLAPEGRLYIVRFDRFSPWFWRHGRCLTRRSGAPALPRPISLAHVQRHGLSLEYRHALGSRGLRSADTPQAGSRRDADRWPLVSALRASRVWVLRKRRQNLVLTRRAIAKRAAAPAYGLATVRREAQDRDA